MEGAWFSPILTSCRLHGSYAVRTHAEIVDTPDRHHPTLVELAQWSTTFLTRPNPQLGRSGSVCPFSLPAISANTYFLADTFTDGSALEDVAELMRAAKTWHQETAELMPTSLRPLLTLLVPLPWIERSSSAEIDRVQGVLKDEYVKEGLMVGQFHPRSEAPGLWNDSFRPLRTSTPLLAIRFMTVGDVVFLTSSSAHLDAYLRRFAPDIPARARVALTALATKPAA